MRAKIENKTISINLSEDEVLVLFEWLQNFNQEKRPTLFQDQAEERILFDLEAELEKIVSGTFEGNYQEILSKARKGIRDVE